MRLLHIDTGRDMRGGQWQVLFLLRGLRDRGHECVLLARAGAPLARAAKQEGFDVRAAGILGVRRLRTGFDAMHAHDARAHMLAALFDVPHLVVARRVAFPLGSGRLSHWKYSRGERFIAVSRYVGERLLDAGIDETRIRVVYDGVPVLEPKPPGDRVLAPATSDARKGSDLARDAARLAGVDLTFSNSLLTDLPGARAFVYLTREEGLGSAALLAMSAGVPVLASAVGGLREIVADRVTGLLTGNNVNSIAVRMRRLVEDAPLGAALAAEARRQVLERFTVDAMVDRTLDVYRELAR